MGERLSPRCVIEPWFLARVKKNEKMKLKWSSKSTIHRYEIHNIKNHFSNIYNVFNKKISEFPSHRTDASKSLFFFTVWENLYFESNLWDCSKISHRLPSKVVVLFSPVWKQWDKRSLVWEFSWTLGDSPSVEHMVAQRHKKKGKRS